MIKNEKTRNIEMLVDKWDKKGFKLSELKYEVAKNTAILLENEYNQYILKETVSSDISDFKKIVMPMVRRIFPTLIANDLVSVQPMSAPVGLAYALRFKYGTTTAGGATAGDEAGYNTLHQGYSGQSTVTPSSGAKGVTTAQGEAFGDGIAQEILDLKMGVETVTVTAKERKLKTSYTLEAMQDAQAMHSLDLEGELLSMLQYELAAEIDREVINSIHDLCTIGNDNRRTVTVASSDGQWQLEKFRTLYTDIVKEANRIAIRTRTGPGNFLLCSPDVVTALESLSNFLISPINTGSMDLGVGVAKVGSIDGRFDVYRDTFAPANTNYVTIGRKGPVTTDAGVIYSPYVPILISKAVNPNTFHPTIGVMSRYALTNHLFGAEKYYSRLDVDFTGVL